MPTRLLREGICTSEPLAALSFGAEVLFYRLLVIADDFGLADGRPVIVRAKAMPLRDVTLDQVDAWLTEIVTQQLIIRYEVDGKPYIAIHKFRQRTRAATSKCPPPTADWLTSAGQSSGDRQSTAGHMTDAGRTPAHVVVVGVSTNQPVAALPAAPRPKRPQKSLMPADFAVSDRVADWAASHGYTGLDDHLDAFRRKCAANGYAYLDWDAAFMEAVREDWAKLRVVRDLRQAGGLAEPKSQLRELS